MLIKFSTAVHTAQVRMAIRTVHAVSMVVVVVVVVVVVGVHMGTDLGMGVLLPRHTCMVVPEAMALLTTILHAPPTVVGKDTIVETTEAHLLQEEAADTMAATNSFFLYEQLIYM